MIILVLCDYLQEINLYENILICILNIMHFEFIVYDT